MGKEALFQSELVKGFSQFDCLPFKIPDQPGKSGLWLKVSPKPYDLHVYLPEGNILAIELKACSNQSWNIRKDGDSSSLKEHQYDYLCKLHELKHYAFVAVNFTFNASDSFKKSRRKLGKKDILYGKNKNQFYKSFLVPIAVCQAFLNDGQDKISLEEFEDKKNSWELARKRVNNLWITDVEEVIMFFSLRKDEI